jgi:hypothetical protein
MPEFTGFKFNSITECNACGKLFHINRKAQDIDDAKAFWILRGRLERHWKKSKKCQNFYKKIANSQKQL